MMLKKCVGLFAVGGVVTAVTAAGCSAQPGTQPDAGETPDTGTTTRDATPDRRPPPSDSGGGDARPLDCTPQPVPNPTVGSPAYKPPSKQQACTTAQISSFITAINSTTTGAVAAWRTANPACAACAVTNTTAAGWGAIVCIPNQNCYYNLGGCLDLINSGAGCGSAFWASGRCYNQACSDAACCADPANCTPAEDAAQNQCYTDAETAVCKPASDAVDTACTGLQTDAGQAAAIAQCGLGQGVTADQRTTALLNTFCFTQGDGGGGG